MPIRTIYDRGGNNAHKKAHRFWTKFVCDISPKGMGRKEQASERPGCIPDRRYSRAAGGNQSSG